MVYIPKQLEWIEACCCICGKKMRCRAKPNNGVVRTTCSVGCRVKKHQLNNAECRRKIEAEEMIKKDMQG
jgi:hypothetical protein